MKYNILGKIDHAPGRAECVIDAPAPAATGHQFEGRLQGTIVLVNTGERIAARGRLQGSVVLNCSRCLRPHSVPLDIVVDEICSLEQIDQVEVGQDGENGTCPIPLVDHEVVNLRELVRELLILNIPPRSLCRPDCRGLCPHCGQDLNEGQCKCDEQQVDPRLAPLQKLRQQ